MLLDQLGDRLACPQRLMYLQPTLYLVGNELSHQRRLRHINPPAITALASAGRITQCLWLRCCVAPAGVECPGAAQPVCAEISSYVTPNFRMQIT